MNIKSRTRRLTILTMLLGMALVVNIIEPEFPIGIPGVKLGLANSLSLLTFYLFGIKEMVFVNLMRVLIVGILRGNFLSYGFWASFSGAILSLIAVYIFTKTTKMSEIGVSVASATFHNVGQMIIIILVTDPLLITYLPILLLFGIPSSILIGYLVKKVHLRFSN